MLRGLSNPRQWAATRRLHGLARGWLGWAWSWLVGVRHGVVADRQSTRDAIAARLERRCEYDNLVGLMIGSAAAPTVAASLAALDPTRSGVLEDQIARWIAGPWPDHPREVMLGSAGTVLAAAEIEALAPGVIPRAFIAARHAEVRRELEARFVGSHPGYLGMAHGIAGVLLALEAGRSTFGLPLSSALRRRAIGVLMSHRVRGPGNIANWPRRRDGEPIRFLNGWCHGATGIALVALAGHRLSRDPAYEPLIDCALPSAYTLRGGSPEFCCGVTGQCQLYLEAHRLLGDRIWYARARAHARTIADWRPGGRTFHRGRLGQLYLQLRLESPISLPLPGLGPLSV